MALHDIVQPHIADFEHDGKNLSVTCRIAFDASARVLPNRSAKLSNLRVPRRAKNTPFRS